MGWLLIIILVDTSDTVSFSAKDELFYKDSLKRSVLKSQFHNPWNLDQQNWFVFTIHAKATSNSRWNKNIKYAFIPTAKGRSLDVSTKYKLFYKERSFSTRP